MKGKLIFFCVIVALWGGLSSCAAHANYKQAKEEAERRNAVIAQENLRVATDTRAIPVKQ